MGRTLCSRGNYFLNRHSLGHLIHGGRCVVGRTLCSPGEYAVLFFEYTLLGASPQSGRCVVGRTLCCYAGKYFLNRHSLGHLLRVDAVLWDVRCVLKGSTLVG